MLSHWHELLSRVSLKKNESLGKIMKKYVLTLFMLVASQGFAELDNETLSYSDPSPDITPFPKETCPLACPPPCLPEDPSIRSAGFLELSGGYLLGSLKLSTHVGNAARTAKTLQKEVQTKNRVLFPNNAIQYPSGNGYVFGAHVGWLNVVPKSCFALGLSAGAATLFYHSIGTYPIARIGRDPKDKTIVLSVLPREGLLTLKDKGYMDVSAQFGLSFERTLMTLSLGWVGHKISGELFGVRRFPLFKMHAKIVHGLLLGLSFQMNVTSRIRLGATTRIHLGKTTSFSKYKSLVWNQPEFGTLFGGLTNKVRPMFVEALVTAAYLLPY
jgi:hypothetical protein